MIYLNTGANGSGKTLNALKFICEVLNPDGDRPVFYWAPKAQPLTPTDYPGNPLSDWQEITESDCHNWQDYPDGSIFFIDEFRHIWPYRVSRDKVPLDVDALSEHRSHGFDFVLSAQKPSAQFDPYIQGFIDQHVHMYTTNSKHASKHIITPAFCSSPFNPPKLIEGDVVSKVVRFDKKYYDYYKSASVHTKVNKLPVKRLALIALLPLLLVGFAYMGYSALSGLGKSVADGASESVVFSDNPASSGASSGTVPRNDSSYYIDRYIPRVDGLAYTAPFYDSVVEPKSAPFPSSCIAGIINDVYQCKCYTSQATALDTPLALCEAIARDGWFDFTRDPSGTSKNNNRSQRF
jgi:zona occludens toxin